jgi:heme/copper-type cytochrome/quinol oxidase subunit 2
MGRLRDEIQTSYKSIVVVVVVVVVVIITIISSRFSTTIEQTDIEYNGNAKLKIIFDTGEELDSM